jgi:hypothetical protein
MLERLLGDAKRLYWPLGIAAACLLLAFLLGVNSATLGIIVFKFLVFGPAVALVHVARTRLFNYIDLSEVVTVPAMTTAQAIKDGAIIFATIVFYCWMTSSLVSVIG